MSGKTRKTLWIIGIILGLVAVAGVGYLILSVSLRAIVYRRVTPGTALAGTEWVLVSLNGNAPIEGKAITLRFGDSSIEGSGGCNTYGGSYTASEDGLSLSGVYWTEMACSGPKGIVEQEQAYFQALNAAAGYSVDGERLELYDENGIMILKFVAAGAANPGQSNALLGTEWTPFSLNGDAPLEGRKVTLSFYEDSIDGSAGCNTYGGSYTASDDSLSFGGVYATEMECMESAGIMEQERVYLDALNAAARYQIAQDQGSGDRLELYDGAGTLILAFVASTAEEDMPMGTTPELSLDCTLEMDETHPAGEPVNLRFALHNPTDRPLYVLTWYTPLEGMAGDILRVTRDGAKIPYQGMLAKRGDPVREEYVAIEPGEATSAQVDLRMGYDLSTPRSYQVQFTTGLQDVSDDASLVPQKRDDHRPQSLSCNPVSFRIVPAPELPTATPTPTDVPPTATPLAAATPMPGPPAGFRRYVNGASGVSLWVPESWTVVEPGPPRGGSPILQSYPQDKYVGGEPRQPGDTKCDLIIHPPGTSAADVVPRNRSDPPVTVVSEREIVLRSGQPGTRFEVESMGRSLSLVTEVNGRTVVLICFGELEPFDAIAVTLDAPDIE